VGRAGETFKGGNIRTEKKEGQRKSRPTTEAGPARKAPGPGGMPSFPGTEGCRSFLLNLEGKITLTPMHTKIPRHGGKRSLAKDKKHERYHTKAILRGSISRGIGLRKGEHPCLVATE